MDPPPESEKLRQLRDSLDNFDSALIHLLMERFKRSEQIRDLKMTHHLPPLDPKREREHVATLRARAAEAGLNPQFAESFLKFVRDPKNWGSGEKIWDSP